MARINIEDSIHSDRRFFDLIMRLKDIDKAYGVLVRMWILAQKWYLTETKMIPADEWKKQLIDEAVIDTGWAERVGDYVRVCGADKQFAWLEQRVEAGRKGGLSRRGKKLPIEEAARRHGARVALNKAVQTGQIIKPTACSDCGMGVPLQGHHSDYSKPLDVVWVCDKCHDNIHAELELATAKRPLSEPKPPSLSPPQSLNTNQENTILPESEKLKPAARDARFDFDALYKKYPRKEGKSRGMKTCQAKIKTQADYDNLSRAIDRYAAYCQKNGTEPQFVKHFATFMSQWTDWLDPQTGTTTLSQAPPPTVLPIAPCGQCEKGLVQAVGESTWFACPNPNCGLGKKRLASGYPRFDSNKFERAR